MRKTKASVILARALEKEQEHLETQLVQVTAQLRKEKSKVKQLKKHVTGKNTKKGQIKALLKEMAGHLDTIIELA